MKLRWPKLGYERRRSVEGMLFIAPWLAGFLAFLAYPLYSSLTISLTKSTLTNLTGGSYIGLENYKTAVVDPLFAIHFSSVFERALLDVPIIVIFSLFIAVLLNTRGLVGRNTFRAIYFVPVVVSGVVMTLLYQQEVLLVSAASDLDLGATAIGRQLSGALDRLGLICWRSSVEILIFLAGMQSIPRALYEAAEVDGATAWERFWKITLPSIAPIALLNVVYATIDTVMEPLNMMMAYIKFKLFMQTDFGVAAAMSWIYFLVAAVVVLAIMFAGRRLAFHGNRR